MLEQYQTEIFALLALLLVVLIYLLIKGKNPKDSDSLEEIQTETTIDEPQEVLVDEYDTPEVDSSETQEKLTKKAPIENTPIEETLAEVAQEPEDEFTGKEEGSFSDTPQQRQNDKIDDIKPKHHIAKRDVPPHGKITKKDFKEFAGTRVLVAEDNIINQKVIKGLLADTGIEVTIADDGQECLDILEKDSDFLLILMDAHMPRVDGFEATRAIRANPDYEHILVVALSGDTAADDIKKMTEAGMSEQLEKPLRMEALYDIFYAYSIPEGSAEESEDEEFVNVIVTKELHGDKGLEICGGDEEFYHEILAEFVNDYGNSTQKLGDLLRVGELQAADKLLLDIVGVTANIGADNLNRIAQIIKSSLNDTTEKSYLTLLQEYKASLDNLLADIKEYK
ncbi:MAG: response regulator [Campylobacterota bacterium]|nr:response regulator [Campylobacterota bacterium]